MKRMYFKKFEHPGENIACFIWTGKEANRAVRWMFSPRAAASSNSKNTHVELAVDLKLTMNDYDLLFV